MSLYRLRLKGLLMSWIHRTFCPVDPDQRPAITFPHCGVCVVDGWSTASPGLSQTD